MRWMRLTISAGLSVEQRPDQLLNRWVTHFQIHHLELLQELADLLGELIARHQQPQVMALMELHRSEAIERTVFLGVTHSPLACRGPGEW